MGDQNQPPSQPLSKRDLQSTDSAGDANQTPGPLPSVAGRVALGFVYFFLVMTSYYILKPVRESFFLGEQGYQNLPKAHLLVMAATFVTMLVYTRASHHWGISRLVAVANVFFLACIAGFWFTLTQWEGESVVRSNLAWVYYCWVSVFAVFAVTLFWSVIHTIFTPEEGSWTYGFIGAGGTVGALTGGWLTSVLAEQTGTENLLLIALVILTPCIPLGVWLAGMSVSERATPDRKNLDVPARSRSSSLAIIKIFRRNRYLCVLGLIVMFTIMISVMDEYRYSQIIVSALTEENMRTAFYGRAYFYTNVLGLVFSIGITGPVQSRFGPLPGMLLYAFLVIGTGLWFVIAPNVQTVFWSTVALQSVAYSIYQWSRELCYTATTREEKLVAKGFIDTFMFRFGAGTAALALIGLGTFAGGRWFLDHATTHISLVTIPLATILACMAIWISARFQRLIASAPQSPQIPG